MKITISDRLLSLPLMQKPERLAVLVRLLLNADEAGIVRLSLDEMCSSSGVLAPTLRRSVEEFETSGLVTRGDGTLQLMPSVYWSLSGRASRPRKKAALPIRAEDIDTRIERFKERFAEEMKRWAEKHSEYFPEDEQRKFVEYWTAHNIGDRKFLAEKGTWMWQNRINTWASKIKRYGINGTQRTAGDRLSAIQTAVASSYRG